MMAGHPKRHPGRRGRGRGGSWHRPNQCKAPIDARRSTSCVTLILPGPPHPATRVRPEGNEPLTGCQKPPQTTKNPISNQVWGPLRLRSSLPKFPYVGARVGTGQNTPDFPQRRLLPPPPESDIHKIISGGVCQTTYESQSARLSYPLCLAMRASRAIKLQRDGAAGETTWNPPGSCHHALKSPPPLFTTGPGTKDRGGFYFV